jgi:hypothetical protein
MKALLDPNFLSLLLWSKTKLCNQHMHLGLLWILGYAFIFKSKHKLRINISGNYKIMINSPEVYLGIKRSYPEVGYKNVFIFVYKNNLDRFSLNTK